MNGGTWRNESSHGDEGGGAGASGGKVGSGGKGVGDASVRFERPWLTLQEERETVARVAKGTNAAAGGGVITIMLERYESAEIEHVLLAGAEYSNLSNAPGRKKIDREEHRSCGVDTDEADQQKPLAPPRLQFLAAFMCCAIYSPMTSSAAIETFQRYHEDLIAAALNVRGAQWEQFLTGVRKFKVTKPIGWCKHTTNMVKFICDIGDDVLRQAVVATVMKYKSAKLVPPWLLDSQTLRHGSSYRDPE